MGEITRSTKRFDDFNAHFPGEISHKLSDFVRDECLIGSRYLFVRRCKPFSTIQFGFCTHCKVDYVIQSKTTLKHNTFWQCEKCKSPVQVKSAGLGRGKMIDRAYVIWYEKSQVDPNAIVCVGYKVQRDYRDKIDIETEFIPVMRCLFKKGSALMALRDHYSTGIFANQLIHFRDGWRFAANPHSLMGKHYFTQLSYQSVASIQEAVKGTLFQYSEWNRCIKSNMDMVIFFSAFAKYPFIEYMIKMGMDDLADQIVKRDPVYNAINFKGKSMEKILGLSKRELKEWKDSGSKMEARMLRTYKWFRDRGAPIGWDTASRCGYLLEGQHYKEAMDFILKHSSLDRMIRYAESQLRKAGRRYHDITSVITDWRDYIQECIALQMDVTEERFLFPNNIHAAHQKNRAKIKMKEDPALDARIVLQQRKLSIFAYSNGDHIIRPITSLAELFDEGGELVHCVGSYAERYAKGDVAILCIRRSVEPDKPFYTMELALTSLRIVQCRGFDNCEMTEEVREFVNEFTAKKLLTRRKRIDTTGIAPTQRQEAIV